MEVVDRTNPTQDYSLIRLARLNPRCRFRSQAWIRSTLFLPSPTLFIFLSLSLLFTLIPLNSETLPPLPFCFLLSTNLSYPSFIVGDVSVSLFDRSGVFRVPCMSYLWVENKASLPRVAFELASKTMWTLYHFAGRLCFSPRHYIIGHSFLRSSRQKTSPFYS